MSEIHIFFIDELTVGQPDDVITFGRSADIEVDDANQYMHRIVGTFFFRDNVWWLANKSRHGNLTLVGNTGRLTRLPPEAVSALSEPTGVLRFDSGPSTYELGWTLPGQAPLMPPLDDLAPDDEDATTQFGVVPLNDEQRLLLVALSERCLQDSSASTSDLPPNAAVAHRLGWSAKKLDRKLDYLCARLSAEGVRGLRGEKGFEAIDRRSRLVEHVTSSGMVRVEDLDLLPE
ncbi:MAG: hypothetical protein R8J94_04760 [Acidimicrobiia bacterium]|nr:hypothetical protein [Acidimicrobiia bacterium]